MTDYHLKFPSYAVMLDALRPLGLTTPDADGAEQVLQASHHHAAWVVGAVAFPSSATLDDLAWFDFVAAQPDTLLPMFKRHPKFALADNGVSDIQAAHEVSVHLNIRADDTLDLSSLGQYLTTPESPSTVWA